MLLDVSPFPCLYRDDNDDDGYGDDNSSINVSQQRISTSPQGFYLIALSSMMSIKKIF